jgi:hypothetical protein
LAKQELQEMKVLEDQFQSTLSRYASTYKQYMEDVVKFVNDENSKYSGKNVREPDGAIYYVTNAGVAKWYSQDSWNKKHTSCANTQLLNIDSVQKSGLKMGKPMRAGQPCGYEMQNVKITTEQSKIIDLTKLDGVVASQNTTYQSRYPAKNAIDGDPKTFNHTQNVRGTWWQVHLRENAYIQKIVIHNREDCCQDRFNIVRLDILDDNGQSIYNTILRRVSEKQMTFLVDNIHKHGRFIRLTQEEQQYLHMSEVQVFGSELEDVKDGNIGYVDENGVLRMYPQNNMTNTSGTCPTLIQDIDEDTWKAFERGENMSPSTLCAIGNVDPTLRQQVIQLNNTLIQLSEEIYKKISETREKIGKVGNQNEIEETYFSEQLQRFKDLFQEMGKINKKSATLDAMLEDSHSKYKIYNYRYVMWTLMAVLLGFITYKHMRR